MERDKDARNQPAGADAKQKEKEAPDKGFAPVSEEPITEGFRQNSGNNSQAGEMTQDGRADYR